jgi:hypothetical protein
MLSKKITCGILRGNNLEMLERNGTVDTGEAHTDTHLIHACQAPFHRGWSMLMR